VIELDDALGDVEGIVVGQRNDARAELDVRGALSGRGEEDVRGTDGPPAAGVVFAPVLLVILSAPRAMRARMSSTVRIRPPKVSGMKHCLATASRMASAEASLRTLVSRRPSMTSSSLMSM